MTDEINHKPDVSEEKAAYTPTLKEGKCVFMWDPSFSVVSLLTGETGTDSVEANSNRLTGIWTQQECHLFYAFKFCVKMHFFKKAKKSLMH